MTKLAAVLNASALALSYAANAAGTALEGIADDPSPDVDQALEFINVESD